MRKLAFWLAAGAMLIAIEANAAATVPCAILENISTANRKALRQINDHSSMKLAAENRHKYKQARAVLARNQWPFTPSETELNTYVFKPADFDGDGRMDRLWAQCGAPSWRRMCLLNLDRGEAKPLELESGWMYLTRIDGRFYIVNDWYGPEGGGYGYPEKDLSLYFRITSKGFAKVCKAKPQ